MAPLRLIAMGAALAAGAGALAAVFFVVLEHYPQLVEYLW